MLESHCFVLNLKSRELDTTHHLSNVMQFFMSCSMNLRFSSLTKLLLVRRLKMEIKWVEVGEERVCKFWNTFFD